VTAGEVDLIKKVMIVDDALFMRTMLRDIFVAAGWQVVAEAESGEQAVKDYSNYQPDIVTMDVVMPTMSGIDALRQILCVDSAACIVVCSALGQKHLIIDAIQVGAKDFIVKPFKTEQVLEVVERVISESA
jgi:two-component system, chemotaxis family, chemotaxis protein CheY